MHAFQQNEPDFKRYNQEWGEEYSNLINSFSIEGHISFYDVKDEQVKSLKTHRLRSIFLVSPLKVNATPTSLVDI